MEIIAAAAALAILALAILAVDLYARWVNAEERAAVAAQALERARGAALEAAARAEAEQRRREALELEIILRAE